MAQDLAITQNQEVSLALLKSREGLLPQCFQRVLEKPNIESFDFFLTEEIGVAGVNNSSLQLVSNLKRDLEMMLQGAMEIEIKGLLTRLGFHYNFAVNYDPVVLDSVLGDYVDDLSQYPAFIIANACKVWRQAKHEYFPKSGDLIEVCANLIHPFRRKLQNLEYLEKKYSTPPKPVEHYQPDEIKNIMQTLEELAV